jgi:predicted Zn finger-like uncharacterized protein
VIQALPAFNVSCPSCRTEFPVDPEKVPARGIHAICSTCLRVFRVARPEGYADEDLSEGSSAVMEESGDGIGATAFEVDIEPMSDAVQEALDALQELDFADGEADELEIRGIAGVADDVDLIDVEVSYEVEIVGVETGEEVIEVADDAPVEVSEDVPAEPIARPVADEERAGPLPPEVAEAPPPAPAPPAPPATPRRAPAIVDLTSLAQEAIAEGTGEAGKAELAGSSLSRGADRFRKRGPQERAQRLARVLVSDIIAYYPARYRESFQRGTLKEDFQDEVRKSWKEYVDQVGQELAESTPYFNEALNEVLGQGKQIF